MKKGNLWLPLALIIAFSAQSANAVLIHFDDVPLGVYPVGGGFTSSGVEVTIENMWVPAALSTIVNGNYAEIVNPGMVGPGAGNELKMSNVLANFALDDPCPSCTIALFFAEFGNLVNLGINNSILTAADFADLNGLTIEGALISVIQTPNNQGAMMLINGNVETFQIGGEDLYVDSIFIESVPEPTTIALLGLGVFSLLIKRKKSW
jgi:hypothetical protein